MSTNDKQTDPTRGHEAMTDSPELRYSKALAALRSGDRVAAGWYMYGVGPAGTRPKDCK